MKCSAACKIVSKMLVQKNLVAKLKSMKMYIWNYIQFGYKYARLLTICTGANL